MAKPQGRPARLSRDEIVAAARSVLADEGIDNLTIRKVASRVDATPMALYHHVASKEALLVLLLEQQLAESPPNLDDAKHGRDKVIEAAGAIHSSLTAAPWMVKVLVGDDVMAASSLVMVERIVHGLIQEGLSPESAVAGYRAIWYYTAGEIIVRQSASRRSEVDQPSYRDEVFADVDAASHPSLAGLADRWVDLTRRNNYDAGLSALVDGLIAGAELPPASTAS